MSAKEVMMIETTITEENKKTLEQIGLSAEQIQVVKNIVGETKSQILEKLNNAEQTIDSVRKAVALNGNKADTVIQRTGKTEDQGGGNGVGTVMAKLNALFSVTPIRSIQRGTAVLSGGLNRLHITISNVKPEKSMIILNGTAGGHSVSSNNYIAALPFFANFTSTGFDIKTEDVHNQGLSVSWQVVEFC